MPKPIFHHYESAAKIIWRPVHGEIGILKKFFINISIQLAITGLIADINIFYICIQGLLPWKSAKLWFTYEEKSYGSYHCSFVFSVLCSSRTNPYKDAIWQLLYAAGIMLLRLTALSVTWQAKSGRLHFDKPLLTVNT